MELTRGGQDNFSHKGGEQSLRKKDGEVHRLSLKEYRRKRDFQETSEPEGKEHSWEPGPSLRFVIHKHAATRMHYDLRLEIEGTFKSWAVPKGPGVAPGQTRLAVFVEDHPLEYGLFEGVIPRGNYGAGTVMIWDAGTYRDRFTDSGAPVKEHSQALIQALNQGHLTFVLEGRRLQGEFALIRMQERGAKNWILVKKRDEFASYRDVLSEVTSIATGRNMEEIRDTAENLAQVWKPTGQNQEVAFPMTVSELFFSGPFRKNPPQEKKQQKLPLVTESRGVRQPEKLPRRLTPARAVDGGHQMFRHPDWIFEKERGGTRVLITREPAKVSFSSGKGVLLNTRFPALVESFKTWKQVALLEGEVCHGKKTSEKDERHVLLVSDILHLNGENLRSLPLFERKKQLRDLSSGFPEGVFLREWTAEDGEQLFQDKPEEQGSCLLAKHLGSPWLSGVNRYWLRISRSDKARQSVHLTHKDKVLWPESGITKGELTEYYRNLSHVIIPYLRDRPLSLKRYPHGISGEGFYQKNITGYLPAFVRCERIFSPSSEKTIQYMLCDNTETLLYMANIGCIGIHPWLSRADDPGHPDQCVIDLDPDGHSFSDIRKVALLVREVLETMGVPCFCKTSGSRGIHIVIPLVKGTDYETSRLFALSVAGQVHSQLEGLTSLERTVGKRRKKIYLDCMQNRRSQTLAAPYCVRPVPGALVSAPVGWDELQAGAEPGDFHLRNMTQRIRDKGDIWAGVLGKNRADPGQFPLLNSPDG